MRGAALFGVALAILAAGAELGLAQDQDVNQLQNAAGSSIAPSPLDIPPPEEAPEPAPVPQAPEPAQEPPANAVTAAPQAPPAPPKRPQHAVAILQTLDKVTAETLRFEAKVDEPVRYKDLVITVHACETQASDEPYLQTAAHLDVQYQPDVLGGRTPQVARQVYRGWMFGDAPGLHPFEHPIYDVWLIACKTTSAPAAPPATGARL